MNKYNCQPSLQKLYDYQAKRRTAIGQPNKATLQSQYGLEVAVALACLIMPILLIILLFTI